MANHPNNLVQATAVIGKDVQSPTKEGLGKIEDIMLNKLSGEVHYAVLSFGGIFGVGDKLFALPWKSLHYSVEDKCFILNTTKEKLKDAPGFDKGYSPDMADAQWQASIKRFYDETTVL